MSCDTIGVGGCAYNKFPCWDLSIICWDLSIICWDLSIICWDLSIICWDLSMICWDLSMICWDLSIICWDLSIICWDLSIICWDLSWHLMIFSVINENSYVICVSRHNKWKWILCIVDKIHKYNVHTGLERVVLLINLNTILYWDLLNLVLKYRVLLHITMFQTTHLKD